MASYAWKLGPSKITAQFNVDNLLDKDYFVGVENPSTRVGAHFGAPRSFLGSIRVEF